MKTIYGLHDRGGEHLMVDAGQPGWVVVTEAIGSNPNDRSGGDYRSLSGKGLDVIVRLNNGYGAAGTLPHASLYESFAQRCANFVANTVGADRFIIGNEPNHQQEWPDGMPISHFQYCTAFKLAREAIQARRQSAQVITAAIAPWNIQSGDWLAYFAGMLALLKSSGADGIALHTYTHGADPSLIASTQTMDPPFADRYFHFRHFEQFLRLVPGGMRHLPVYITETNQGDGPWANANRGWVQEAYAEIDLWNAKPETQKVHCLCLYRWSTDDQWSIQNKPGVIEDFKAALQQGYALPRPESFQQPHTAPGSGYSSYLPIVEGGVGAPPSVSPPALVWDERLTRRGIKHIAYQPSEGEWYWRLVRADYLEQKEHTFVDTLDEAGNSLPGVEVVFWNGGSVSATTKDIRSDPYALGMANFPMYSPGWAYAVRVEDGPSDEVHGMGLGSVEQPEWNIHVSYRFVFQRTRHAAQAETPVPTRPAIDEPPTEPTPAPTPLPAGIIDPALALAFLQVESGGQPFIDGLLAIRFEVHIFQAELGNDALFNAHFKYVPRQYDQQFWRPTPDEPWRPAHGAMRSRHELLAFARSLNDTAALRSTGMGMGQVMGSNAARIGYPSPQVMYRAFSHEQYGRNAQLWGFVNYVLSDAGLTQALRARDLWTAVTKYNGEGQQSAYIELLNDALMRVKQAIGLAEGA